MSCCGFDDGLFDPFVVDYTVEWIPYLGLPTSCCCGCY